MKVLLISMAWPSTAAPSLGPWARDVAVALTRAGHGVDVLSPVPYVPPLGRYRRYRHIPPVYRDGLSNVMRPRVPRVNGRLAQDILYPLAMADWYAMLPFLRAHLVFTSYDVIHSNAILPDGYWALRISQQSGRPYVLQNHDIDASHSIPRRGPARRAARSVVENASAIMHVSRYVQMHLQGQAEYRVPETIIYNHVDAVGAAPRAPGFRYFASVGSLIERKRQAAVVRALQRVSDPDLHVVLIGRGPEEVRLRRLADELGVSERTHFLGALSREETLSWMAGAVAMALPSVDEPCGNVYVEAMQLGVPPIAARGFGIGELLEGTDAGVLVDPDDVEGLAAAMHDLATESIRAKHSLAAAELGMSLTLEDYARNLVQVYREAIAR